MDKELICQYEFIRNSGVTNMLDLPRVRQAADDHGFAELGIACRTQSTYVDLLTHWEPPDPDDYRAWLRDKVEKGT